MTYPPKTNEERIAEMAKVYDEFMANYTRIEVEHRANLAAINRRHARAQKWVTAALMISFATLVAILIRDLSGQ